MTREASGANRRGVLPRALLARRPTRPSARRRGWPTPRSWPWPRSWGSRRRSCSSGRRGGAGQQRLLGLEGHSSNINLKGLWLLVGRAPASICASALSACECCGQAMASDRVRWAPIRTHSPEKKPFFGHGRPALIPPLPLAPRPPRPATQVEPAEGVCAAAQVGGRGAPARELCGVWVLHP